MENLKEAAQLLSELDWPDYRQSLKERSFSTLAKVQMPLKVYKVYKKKAFRQEVWLLAFL
jgi:hypothetical protein